MVPELRWPVETRKRFRGPSIEDPSVTFRPDSKRVRGEGPPSLTPASASAMMEGVLHDSHRILIGAADTDLPRFTLSPEAERQFAPPFTISAASSRSRSPPPDTPTEHSGEQSNTNLLSESLENEESYPNAMESSPRSLEVEIILHDTEPFDSRGHFCDVFRGTHITEGKVALKRLRNRSGNGEEVEKLARRETGIWMQLSHEHILKCLGVFTRDGHLYIASQLMEKGNLLDWICSGGLTGPDRLRLICELAAALVYLHGRGIVHGDVKAENVLLSDELRVQLCDFGLTKLIGTDTAAEHKGAGSMRWQSPELWSNEPKTSSSDVYAFAMTITEILTGQVPFAEMKYDSAVMMAVFKDRKQPTRSPEISSDGTSYTAAWNVAQRCWPFDAKARISMEKAATLLNDHVIEQDKDASLNPVAAETTFETEADIVVPNVDAACPHPVNPTPSPITDFENDISLDSSMPLDSRSNMWDVFVGTHRSAGRVALKRSRQRRGGGGNVKVLKEDPERKTDFWMGLRHDGILKCLSAFTRGSHVYFVSPFMKNGKLGDWLQSKVHVGLERLRLIGELADAISFLHIKDIVHGGVKADSVLISDDDHVQLTGFGLAESDTSTALRGAESVRWQGPELWNNDSKSFASDVYAFSMTIVEVLTDKIPFASIAHDPGVLKAVYVRGERPIPEPETSPDGTSYANAWDVAKQGWHKDADQRISMRQAVDLLLRTQPGPPAEEA